MNESILLVEDNAGILRANARMLKGRGYVTMTAATLAEARVRIAEKFPDAIVLDIMLPDGDGLDFMRELRQTSNVPILLLTGRTTPEDIVSGLARGGDDYLTKPYDLPVLLAHVEALLRRAAQIPDKLVKGALTLDVVSGQAFLNGADMLLTQKEFALLLLLAQHEGQTVSAEYLYEKAWRMPMENDSQAIRTIVSRLRVKIKGSGYDIKTMYKGGYRFQPVKAEKTNPG